MNWPRTVLRPLFAVALNAWWLSVPSNVENSFHK